MVASVDQDHRIVGDVNSGGPAEPKKSTTKGPRLVQPKSASMADLAKKHSAHKSGSRNRCLAKNPSS